MTLAEDGYQAVEMLAVGGHLPDVILMDVDMPRLDGISAAAQIRALEHCRDIPVIMVTSSGTEQTLEAAFDAGATDFLAKPIRKLELRSRVRAALTLKRETDRRKLRETELLAMAKELEEANAQLLRLSETDFLCRIANRRRLDAKLHEEWPRGARELTRLAVLMIDVDHFKAFNDRYGHLAGDDCLVRVAEAIWNALQRPSDLAGRYGGEEFAVVLPDTDENGAVEVARRIHAEILAAEIPHSASPFLCQVTVSVGVASMLPTPGTDVTALVTAADAALYAAKRNGRNRTEISSEHAGANANRRRFRRFPVELSGRCHVCGGYLEVTVLDISRGGACVDGADAIVVGTLGDLIVVELAAPFEVVGVSPGKVRLRFFPTPELDERVGFLIGDRITELPSGSAQQDRPSATPSI